MLHNTRGIILRSVKYGETSLVTTVFTETYGIQAYMVQGVRSAKQSKNRAGLLQPAMLADIIADHQPQKNLQRLREFPPAYIYKTVQENIIKNSIAVFCSEILLRLLPEQAPQPELFNEAFDFFIQLDNTPVSNVANYPLYFVVLCSRYLGYDIGGAFSEDTPYVDIHSGGFTAFPPSRPPYLSIYEARALGDIIQAIDYNTLANISMSASDRLHITEWYIAFLQQHTQHMGAIKSLSVLHAVLH